MAATKTQFVMKDGEKDYSSSWPFALEADGWYRAHNALRANLAAIDSLVVAFREQLAAGSPITPAQASASKAFIAAFLHFLQHHHHCEEDIAFAYFKSRFQPPEGVSADHKAVEGLMASFGEAHDALVDAASLEAQRAELPKFAELTDKLHSMLKEHFKEEETEAMPRMRAYFSHREIAKNVTSKIVRSLDATETGIFFRAMTLEERRAFARQEKIPFFIRWILWSRVNKYDRNIWQPFQRECLAAAPVA